VLLCVDFGEPDESKWYHYSANYHVKDGRIKGKVFVFLQRKGRRKAGSEEVREKEEDGEGRNPLRKREEAGEREGQGYKDKGSRWKWRQLKLETSHLVGKVTADMTVTSGGEAGGQWPGQQAEGNWVGVSKRWLNLG
jgi:hypothetical protein